MPGLLPIDTSDQFFVLDENRRPVSATYEEWAAFPKERAKVAETRLGPIEIITAFDGVSFFETERGLPELFQTMVIFDRSDDEIYTWPTWETAEHGHRRLVKHYTELPATWEEQAQLALDDPEVPMLH